MSEQFEPKIVAFFCKWCASAGADLAGVSRLKYPPNLIPLHVLCSGRIDPQFVLDAFEKGADGVLIGGCHTPNDCHYLTGNFKAFKRYLMLKKVLEEAGIETSRLRLEWISATEGRKLARVATEFVQEIKKLGPLERREHG
jgi:F420-non-reducing hydrogenase iron-sulfur subunit